MATTKKSTSSSKTTSTRKSVWGLNKVSMYVLVAVALLYVISMVLSLVGGINPKIINVLKDLATAIIVVIVSILAWRYVKPKQMVWKVLYVICLLLVIAGVIVPLVV